ncbi:protein of unknown function [Tepidibacter aestuarii]|nr:protein of unknown function [Tepidibacter aestuarii]
MINRARFALDGGSWFGKEGNGYMKINIAYSRDML